MQDCNIVFCNPASGWEKGCVENKVGYERRNYFVPAPMIRDFYAFNKELLKKCDDDGERIYNAKSKKINLLFQEETEEMLELSKSPYEVYKLESMNWLPYLSLM